MLDDEVCEDCNSGRFSSLDGDFVRYVKELLNSYHPDVMAEGRFLQRGYGVQFDEIHQTWLSVNMDGKGKPIVLTQIVLSSDGRALTALDARHEKKARVYIRNFIEALGKSESIAFERMIISGVEGLEPAFIFSSEGKIAIRARDEETYERLLDQVRSGKVGIALQSITEQIGEQPLVVERSEAPVPIRKQLSIPIGNIYRSAAKIALELACVVGGPNWLAHTCFDRVKSFVMGTDVNLVQYCPVREVRGDHMLSALEGQHLAMASRIGPKMLVYLVLYQRPGWVIHLTDTLPDDFPLNVPAIFIFDYRNHYFQRLDWEVDFDSIVELMRLGVLTPPSAESSGT